MTTPTDGRPDEQQLYVVEPAPETTSNRSGSNDSGDEDRGRPVGQLVAGGGSVLAGGGSMLYSFAGLPGLAVGALTAAGGTATYVAYRMRGNRPGFKMGRSRGSRSPSRLGSVGKGGRGKGPKLLGGKGAKLGGGKGPKLGKGGGPKLGRGGGKLLGGRGAKLGGGKSGKLLGGKAGKLGGGRAGRLLGGGRGSKLGGKAGLGLGKGRSTARHGSVGTGRSGLLGRGKTGLGLGKRGGKLLGGKGKAGLGRWSKSTGAGAGLLGGKFGRGVGKLNRRARAAALRTHAGRNASRGLLAAKVAGRRDGTKTRRERWNDARKAARAAMKDRGTLFSRWATNIGAGATAAFAMARGRWRRWRHPEDADAARRINEDVNNASTGAPLPDITPEPDFFSSGSGRRIPTRRHPMSSQFPLATAAGEVQVTAQKYHPQNMWEVDQDMEQVPDLPRFLAQGLQIYTQNLQAAYPINPTVVEALGRMYVALGQVANDAQQIAALFKQAHEDDIRRKTAPRVGEDKWNV